ncbi:MAG: DUF2062 domain-containing protein [Candidatus Omnitrophota bacterium]
MVSFQPGRKRTFIQRIVRWARFFYLKFVRIHDSPHKIALGFSLGVFLGIIPFTGVLAAIFIASVLRVNRVSAVLGSFLVNTWVTIPFFLMSIRIAASLSHSTSENIIRECSLLWNDFHWARLLETTAPKVFLPVVLAYFLLSLFTGIIMYVLALIISGYMQRQRFPRDMHQTKNH